MILYFDCTSGVSGDMLVSALLSLMGATEQKPGVLDEVVRPALRAAGIDGRLVSIEAVDRGGVNALAFKVPGGPGFATFDELIMSMYASKLEQTVADGVAGLAQRMAAAEREVHGHGHVELDELGGLDTAVDLISAVTLIHHLAPERIMALPPALGGGSIETAHGQLSVPAPAVAALLRGLPTAPADDSEELGELTTPTGAALLAHFVEEFRAVPEALVVAAGVGAGAREVPGRPNVLRAFLFEQVPQEEMMHRDADSVASDESGRAAVRRTASGIVGGVRQGERSDDVGGPGDDEVTSQSAGAVQPHDDRVQSDGETVVMPDQADMTEPAEAATMHAGGYGPLDHVVLEANIDDMSAELLAHAADMLREAGALDVWTTAALMKKGRPGVVLHVLTPTADHRRLADLVFAETTTFGLRVQPVARLYAEERRETVKLGGQEVRVRVSLVAGRPATVAPEYEDCRRAAEKLARPVKVVYEAAQAAARSRFSIT